MKYPEFREQFKHGEWFGGHLVKVDNLYYKLVKTEEGKILKSFNYDELTELEKEKINTQRQKEEKLFSEFKTIWPAYFLFIDYVKNNGELFDRSNISESEYWKVKAIDGSYYIVRISNHRHPTGSMTDIMNHKIDSTDSDCRRYCKLFGIKYE